MPLMKKHNILWPETSFYLVGQFSTSSSRNGHSHPWARNACKEQTNSALLISNVNLIINQGVN